MSIFTDFLRTLGKLLGGGKSKPRTFGVGVTVSPADAVAELDIAGVVYRMAKFDATGHRTVQLQSPPVKAMSDGRVAGTLRVTDQTGRTITESFAVQFPLYDTELVAVTLKPNRPAQPFPPENEIGLLHTEGDRFADGAGRTWDWRGRTMFMLFARFWRGDDITADIAWLRVIGVNVARILIAGHPGIQEWSDNRFIHAWQEDAHFWQKYRQFLDYMWGEGLRVETTVMSDRAKSQYEWRDILQRVYDINDEQGRSHFVEWANEPGAASDRAALDWIINNGGINRKGVLSSYGIELEGMLEGFKPSENVLDYLTARSSRGPKYAQNGKELRERADAIGKPVVDDEPLGVAEPANIGGRQRTADERQVANHFTFARMFGAGTTMHDDAGLAGRIPNADEPVQQALAQAVSRIWQFVPGDAYIGEYLAPHVRDSWPIEWQAGRDSDVNHAYGSKLGDNAILGCVLARDGWTVVPKPGWHVTERGPYDWLAKIARD